MSGVTVISRRDGAKLLIATYDGREDYSEDRWATMGLVAWSVLHEQSNTVKLTLDPKNPPPLTEEQKVQLAALAALADDQIDTTDAPFRPDAVWVKAVDFPDAK